MRVREFLAIIALNSSLQEMGFYYGWLTVHSPAATIAGGIVTIALIYGVAALGDHFVIRRRRPE